MVRAVMNTGHNFRSIFFAIVVFTFCMAANAAATPMTVTVPESPASEETLSGNVSPQGTLMTPDRSEFPKDDSEKSALTTWTFDVTGCFSWQ